ncbi:MAG: hypothetical protein ACTHJ4_05835 [Candidatus Nucleicultricaceae bacterium]
MIDSKTKKLNDILVFIEDDETISVFNEVKWGELELKQTIKKGTIKEVVEYLVKTSSPKYLILDLSSSKLPISDMQKVANVCDPGTNVVAIGIRNDVGLFRDLMTLGIRDYVAKPLNVSLLTRTLQRLVKGYDDDSQFNFLSPGQNIGFIGVSGGAGCSTIAANTASCITTHYGKSLTLVDLDLRFAGSTKLFNIALKAGFRELLDAKDEIDSVMVQRCLTVINENLHVVGGDESIESRLNLSEFAFGNLNKNLKADFQYVFYDIPFGENFALSPWFLKTFKTIVIVSTPTMFQIRDAVRLTNYIKKTVDSSTRIIMVQNLVGMHKAGEIDKEAFEKAVGKKVDVVINFDPNTILEGMNTGTPAALAKGKFSEQIDKLSREIINYHSEPVHESRLSASGLFAKLLKKNPAQ